MRIIAAVFSILLLPFLFPSLISANISNTNVVINEVQVSGDNGSSDEFVELFNPTATDIDMSGWKLVKYNSAGTLANLDSNIIGTIKAFSFYLIANTAYNGSVLPDEPYSANSQNIPSNGAVQLINDSDEVVDTLGLGTSLINETASVENPGSEESVSRTNAIDTDNNFNDFILNEVSDPQNSASVSVSPSPEASPSPSPSVEPSTEPSPEVSPSIEPSPVVSPSPVSTPEIFGNRPEFVIDKIKKNVCENTNGRGKKMGRIRSRLLRLICS